MTPNQTDNVTTAAAPQAVEGVRGKRKVKGPAITKPTAPQDGRQTKQAILVGLLQRPEGASIAELVKATGWQNHSIRGAISFTLKKQLGVNVTSQRDEMRGRVYRIGRAAKPGKASGGRTKKRS